MAPASARIRSFVPVMTRFAVVAFAPAARWMLSGCPQRGRLRRKLPDGETSCPGMGGLQRRRRESCQDEQINSPPEAQTTEGQQLQDPGDIAAAIKRSIEKKPETETPARDAGELSSPGLGLGQRSRRSSHFGGTIQRQHDSPSRSGSTPRAVQCFFELDCREWLEGAEPLRWFERLASWARPPAT